MIFPFEWVCVYIPFLPIAMWETLEAIMPYIIGLQSKYEDFIQNQVDLGNKIIVNLDEGIIFGNDLKEIESCFYQ